VPPFVEVLFVGLGRSTPGSRTERRLAKLTSKAQDLPVVKRRQVVAASSWLKAVQLVARPGDLIVCHPKLRAGELAEELAEMTPFPVYLLASGRPTLAGRLTRRLGRLAFDLFPLAVAAAFFWLQLRIDAQTTGLVNTLAILLTVVVEFGLIFLWSLFLPR
jgi:hypothetical protein